MKLGIYGGTFDPVHNGHLRIATQAERQFQLDRVIFIPTCVPPHKNAAGDGASSADRMEMLQLALGDSKRWEASDIEIRRGGISFTVDTLELMRKQRPSSELFLIMGSDNLLDLDRWRQPEKVASMAVLLVYERPGFPVTGHPPQIKADVRAIQGAPMTVCSSKIRRNIREKKNVSELVPPRVLSYIQAHGLYQ